MNNSRWKYTYRISLNKCACLNKRAPWLFTLTGHISETTKPIWIIFVPFKVELYRSTKRVSSKSDKDKGSFPASAPGAFIQRNTVYGPQRPVRSSYSYHMVKSIVKVLLACVIFIQLLLFWVKKCVSKQRTASITQLRSHQYHLLHLTPYRITFVLLSVFLWSPHDHQFVLYEQRPIRHLVLALNIGPMLASIGPILSQH